jgi:tyrosinase
MAAMSLKPLSRRQFLTTAGAIVTGGAVTAEAGPFRRRRRSWPEFSPLQLGPAQGVRQDVASLTQQQLTSLQNGIAAMKARPASDSRSWRFQANIHGTLDPATSPLFNQCEHGTLLFLAWHRGYVYYFERILRAASGDSTFNLPYWDWTAAPTLPSAFRTPASTNNSLYDATRLINDGSALPSEIIERDLNIALNFTQFQLAPGLGFSPSMEASPHGQVHVLTGGNMSRVQTAANDPIFWLHHCNIDRLWDRWLNLGGGRVNPSDDGFLNRSYSFIDENGATVSLRVRDILSSAQLGYRYDTVANPVSSVPGRSAPPALSDARKPIHAASSHPEAPARAPDSKPLGLKPERVKLTVTSRGAQPLKEATEAARTAGPGKLMVQIEGLSLVEAPNFTYAVYLNLPEGETTAEQAKQHYVCSIDFFGKEGNAHDHGDKAFTATFDVTRVVAQLQKLGRWKPDAISVTFLPLTPIAPPGGEAALRKRSEESARRAKISYKRINLLVTP